MKLLDQRLQFIYNGTRYTAEPYKQRRFGQPLGCGGHVFLIDGKYVTNDLYVGSPTNEEDTVKSLVSEHYFRDWATPANEDELAAIKEVKEKVAA